MVYSHLQLHPMKPIQKLPETGRFAAVYRVINQIIDALKELQVQNSPETKVNRTRNGTTINPVRRATPGDGTGENSPAVWQ